MAEPLLAIDRLDVVYQIHDAAGRTVRRVTALSEISLALARGEAIGVVGESGSGKSTLARAIVGLVAPTSGQIRIEGRDLPRRRGSAARHGVQMIFQDHTSTLNPFQTVARILDDVLALWRPKAGKAERRALALGLLDKVGLGAAALERYPHAFSGGQRQRISIARALAASPRLLICDEPTSALDVSIQAQILDLFAGLKAEGYALIFISHNLAVVNRIAERIIVMQGGRIVEQGATSATIRAPTHPYTQRLVASAPRLTDRGSLLRSAAAHDRSSDRTGAPDDSQ
ncbi:MAG: ABC transporter ATP-binding protein [Parvibaculaceae bacterium]